MLFVLTSRRVQFMLMVSFVLGLTSCSGFESQLSQFEQGSSGGNSIQLDGALLVGSYERVTNPNGSSYLYNSIYYSVDEGQNWFPMNRPENTFRYGPISMLKQDNVSLHIGTPAGVATTQAIGGSWEYLTFESLANTSPTVYDHLEEGSFVVSATSGLLKISQDKGQSWKEFTPQDLGSGGTKTALQVSRLRGRLFAATKYDLIVSDDFGENWQVISYAGDDIVKTDYDPHFTFKGESIFVSSSSLGLFRSNDLGFTWSEVSMPDFTPYREWVHGIEYDGIYLFASGPGGLYKSDDDGLTWNWISSESITGNSETGITQFSSHNGKILVLTRNPTGIYASFDAGSTWKDLSLSNGLPSSATLTQIEVFGKSENLNDLRW